MYWIKERERERQRQWQRQKQKNYKFIKLKRLIMYGRKHITYIRLNKFIKHKQIYKKLKL